MFADPKKVSARRLRRRLKAGVSVGLALVAGAFLACKGGGYPQEEASPMGPDARGGPQKGGEDGSSTSPDGGLANDSLDGASTALVLDGGKDRGTDARAPTVDKQEHRKGMPVRDNLLE
jgi:hypothetical protein